MDLSIYLMLSQKHRRYKLSPEKYGEIPIF